MNVEDENSSLMNPATQLAQLIFPRCHRVKWSHGWWSRCASTCVSACVCPVLPVRRMRGFSFYSFFPFSLLFSQCSLSLFAAVWRNCVFPTCSVQFPDRIFPSPPQPTSFLLRLASIGITKVPKVSAMVLKRSDTTKPNWLKAISGDLSGMSRRIITQSHSQRGCCWQCEKQWQKL